MKFGRPLDFARSYSAELYFFLYNGSIVFILPFLAIMWHDLGFSGAQIGLLAAMRPFVCSISGQMLVGLADSRGWHFAITITTYLATMAARGSMALAASFAAHLMLILASECCQSPFSIITDAAIAASTDEAGYSRKRVLASLGWGALAPLSGWIVGRWGVQHSIAVYFGLVSLALVPTLLLPLRELGCKRTPSGGQEAPEQSCTLTGGSKVAAELGRCSTMLLLKAGVAASGGLDNRQHNGHAAELAIELTDVAAPLLECFVSKASQVESPAVTLRPLLTTADEDAAEQAAFTAKAAAADMARAAGDAAAAEASGEEPWSIPAVGSPLMAQRSNLPPIACPHEAADSGDMRRSPAASFTPGSLGALPAGTPASAAALLSGLGRTVSSASTAFYSVRSGSSAGNALAAATPPSMLWSPRGAGASTGGLPRSALLQQYMGAAATGVGSVLGTPHTTTGHAAAAGAGLVTSGQTAQAQRPPPLLQQVSNLSQALNGFDQSFLDEGSVSDGTFLTPRTGSSLPPAAELGLPEVHMVHPPHFLDGQQQHSSGMRLSGSSIRLLDGSTLLSDGSTRATDGSERSWRRRSSLLPPGGLETTKAPIAVGEPGLVSAPAGGRGARELSLLAAATSLEDGLPDSVAVSISSRAGGDNWDALDDLRGSKQRLGPEASALASPAAAKDMSVWAGICQLLSDPHTAAFFAMTWLMGIGFGCLGYENLYLKESGAPGILLGVALLVSTCGEMPIFFTAGWWLPRLGHELAFNVAMVGWVVRLALYTLLPFFPSPWCVLPVELLQGLTFAMAYGVGTVHAKAIAPPHLRSTTQSIFFSLYYGVGPGISGLAGGYIYQGLGMRWVFIIGSATLALGWASIQLALRWATRGERAAAGLAARLVL